ncbi:hypothetical protein [Nocardia amikacinitolerans]|uniref:hypothetical protein n=1 Tax=Nocardia amikacinitolerans TaxID=756689 RepID=UPI00082B75AE|nr:hypothetical protein [Nocardia amikacinitolerans]
MCIGLLAALPLAAQSSGQAQAAAPGAVCTKLVQVNGVDKEACDDHYYNHLLPECRKRQSRVCYDAATQWYADCLAGKSTPPWRWASTPAEPSQLDLHTPAVLVTAG